MVGNNGPMGNVMAGQMGSAGGMFMPPPGIPPFPGIDGFMPTPPPGVVPPFPPGPYGPGPAGFFPMPPGQFGAGGPGGPGGPRFPRGGNRGGYPPMGYPPRMPWGGGPPLMYGIRPRGRGRGGGSHSRGGQNNFRDREDQQYSETPAIENKELEDENNQLAVSNFVIHSTFDSYLSVIVVVFIFY